jgi:PAS domain S-box-containing protein
VFGWTPTELVGRDVRVLMPEPYASAHGSAIARFRRTGETRIVGRPRALEAVRRDGSAFPIELSVSRIEPIDDRGPTLFVGIIRDLSSSAAATRSGANDGALDRLRLEQLLAEQTAALQAAHLRLRLADRMASVGTLGAGLGHDMHNILLPVRAHLRALERALSSPSTEQSDPGLAHVEAIRRSVGYLERLSAGLHYLALDPDRDNLESVTNLGGWWSEVGVILEKAAPRHVLVRATIDAELPAVRVPPHRLTQAVLNLVVNAGEAIPSRRRGPAGEVRVWAMRGETANTVMLGVTDNGLGMSDEVRRRALELFFTTKPRGVGTGLGLALVQRVVDRAGGRIDIDSAPGAGTSVTLTLPAVSEDDADRAAWELSGVVTLSDGRASDVVEHVLESEGVTARVASSPDSACIWVVSPAPPLLEEARHWKRGDRRRRLIVFGQPEPMEAEAASRLGAVIVRDIDDLDEIRRAVQDARAELLSRSATPARRNRCGEAPCKGFHDGIDHDDEDDADAGDRADAYERPGSTRA